MSVSGHSRSSLPTATLVRSDELLGRGTGDHLADQIQREIFQLPEAKLVSIEIYNILGQKIRILANRNYEAGYHSVNWDGRDINGNYVTSGVYIYKIQAGNWQDVKKMMLIK